MGDYLKKTAHLTLVEHGVYFLMLQAYYSTERPLPVGKQLYRLIRAASPGERKAIDSVVAQYWVHTDLGLVNERAAIEMARMAHQRAVNRELGARGGRPKKKDALALSAAIAKPNGNGAHPPDEVPVITEPPAPDSAPIAQGAAVVEDPRTALWRLGVSLLGDEGRGIIGAAIRRVGEGKVGEVLGTMAIKPPADPKPYFIKATQGRGVVC